MAHAPFQTFLTVCKKVTIEPDDDRMEIVVRGPHVKWVEAFCEDNGITCELERSGLFYYATLRFSEVI